MFFDSVYRAYDRAAIKFRGLDADINFILSDYEEDMKQVILHTGIYIYTLSDGSDRWICKFETSFYNVR